MICRIQRNKLGRSLCAIFFLLVSPVLSFSNEDSFADSSISRRSLSDIDGDGVYDYLDKCPGTLTGLVVDEVGCPIPLKEVVSIELIIYFSDGKDEIPATYDDQIEKVAKFLNTYEDTKAIIEGHTDNVGSEKYNFKLSKKRAEALRNKLITSFGIPPNRLKVVGYGPTRPIASNETPEGRRKNRRLQVSVHIEDK